MEEVFGDSSILSKAGMIDFDKKRIDYKAVIVSLSNAVIKTGLGKNLVENQMKKTELLNAYNPTFFSYFRIIQDEKPEYFIDITSDNQFKLTKANSSTPLFKRENNPSLFLSGVDNFGKWINTLEVKNTDTSFQKDDFIFEIERIEGQSLRNVNKDTLMGKKWVLSPDEEVVFSYVNNLQPAFRLNISIAPNSPLQECFVGALYLDSKYGIFKDLVSDDVSRLLKTGAPLKLGIVMNGRLTNTISLERDPLYDLYTINEITDYLKIFVSSRVIDLSRYKQDSLELDPIPTRALAKGLGTDPGTDNPMDWTVFDFKFRIVGPNKEKKLTAGQSADFGSFTIDVPTGFTANAFAANGDDLIRKQKTAGMRGVDEDIDAVLNNINPPPSIWGDTITETAFSTELATGSDNAVQVLELLAVDGQPVMLEPGQSLVIRPKNVNRSANDEIDDVIIPYGFDEASQLFYQIGSSDENGNIHVDFLPAETDGLIQGDEALTRSLGGSVKMFFRKLFKRNSKINTLVLYDFNNDGTWRELTKDTSEMEDFLKVNPASKVILLTHGLTGDTRHMVAALKELSELPKVADFVLTYDYENLSTPIEDAAKVLHKELKNVGFGKDGIPKIIIIAHSQGALLSRWLVEKEGGSAYVNHLILVAGASSGSELAKLGSSVFGLLTHAINVTGPIKLAITGLSFLLKALKSDPGRTLKDTNPGSDFIKNLGGSKQALDVKYNVIIGDTGLIEREYNGDDTFLQKLKKALAENVVIPGLTLGLFKGEPNDIAVTIKSATSIAGYNNAANTKIVASNHLAYFRKELAQKELMDFLKSQVV